MINAYINSANHFAREMFAVDCAEPYAGANYLRASRQLRAALILAFEGDMPMMEELYLSVVTTGQTPSSLLRENGIQHYRDLADATLMDDPS